MLRPMAKLSCINNNLPPLSDEEVISRIRVLNESTKIHSPLIIPRKNLRELVKILRRSTRKQIQLAGSRVLSTAILILCYYENAVKKSATKCKWRVQRESKIAKQCYEDLLTRFVPDNARDAVEAVLDVIHEKNHFRWEDLCWGATEAMLESGVEGFLVLQVYLDRLEKKCGVEEARAILKILCQMLRSFKWPQESTETMSAVERMLGLYKRSLRESKVRRISPYCAVRQGLEICIRQTMDHLWEKHLQAVLLHICSWSLDSKVSDREILAFAGMLEYGAYINPKGLYSEIIGSDLLEVLTRMLSSSSRLASLLGNRVLQQLLDRSDNRARFRTPKIFYEGTSYDFKVAKCEKEDKYFLQRNRQAIHDSLMDSVTKHCSVRVNLESAYCTVCLIALEVPCGFTAATLVCLAMNLQESILKTSDMRRVASYHVHATIISIMSLLCWIHDAKVFYAYVNKITIERSQLAPHLNPPLKARYSFAVHHVLWDKPELFFVDWETRYGLWKCFRLRENQRRSLDESQRAE